MRAFGASINEITLIKAVKVPLMFWKRKINEFRYKLKERFSSMHINLQIQGQLHRCIWTVAWLTYRIPYFDIFHLPLYDCKENMVRLYEKENPILKIKYLLFSITTEPIVTQKKTPGHWDESTMARTTVETNTTTSTKIPPIIRVLKLPLFTKLRKHFFS